MERLHFGYFFPKTVGTFMQFLKILNHVHSHDMKTHISGLIEAVFKWCGSPHDEIT